MKIYILEFYREFEQSERDWDWRIAGSEEEAIKEFEVYLRDELELDEVAIKDMDVTAMSVVSNEYDIIIKKRNK